MGMLLSRHYANNNNQGVTKAVAPAPSVEKKVESREFEFTAEDINKMAGAKLRKLAKQNGVEDPEELTVSELKSILCDKLCS